LVTGEADVLVFVVNVLNFCTSHDLNAIFFQEFLLSDGDFVDLCLENSFTQDCAVIRQVLVFGKDRDFSIEACLP